MAQQQPKRENSLRQISAKEREKAKYMARRGIMLGLLVLFSLLLLSLTLPWAAEGAMGKSFKQGLQAKAVNADVKGKPALNLLRGKTHTMELWLEFDNASLISMSMLRANWGQSNVALGLIRQGQGSTRDAEPNETELYWDEARFATYLNRVQGEVLVSRVQITSDEVTIYGSISVMGNKHNIQLSGLPHTNDLGQVVFPAQNCQIEGLTITPQLQANIEDALSFEPDLAPLYWKVWAKQVQLNPGRIIVYGSSSCCR